MTTTAIISPTAEAWAPDRAATRAPRRRLLGAAMVAQPALLAVNALFHPDVKVTGEDLLAGAMESPATWFAVHLTASAGAMLGFAAAAGLRRLVRERSPRLANAALVLAGVAAATLSLAFAVEASVLRLAATADLARPDAVALVEDYTHSLEMWAVPVGVLAATLAGVLFAVALLRDRDVPRWMPRLLLVGWLATAVAVPGSPAGPVAFALVGVASVGLARRLADPSPSR